MKGWTEWDVLRATWREMWPETLFVGLLVGVLLLLLFWMNHHAPETCLSRSDQISGGTMTYADAFLVAEIVRGLVAEAGPGYTPLEQLQETWPEWPWGEWLMEEGDEDDGTGGLLDG